MGRESWVWRVGIGVGGDVENPRNIKPLPTLFPTGCLADDEVCKI